MKEFSRLRLRGIKLPLGTDFNNWSLFMYSELMLTFKVRDFY